MGAHVSSHGTYGQSAVVAEGSGLSGATRRQTKYKDGLKSSAWDDVSTLYEGWQRGLKAGEGHAALVCSGRCDPPETSLEWFLVENPRDKNAARSVMAIEQAMESARTSCLCAAVAPYDDLCVCVFSCAATGILLRGMMVYECVLVLPPQGYRPVKKSEVVDGKEVITVADDFVWFSYAEIQDKIDKLGAGMLHLELAPKNDMGVRWPYEETSSTL